MALGRCVSNFLRTLPRSQCVQYAEKCRLSVASAITLCSPYRTFSEGAALDPDQKPKRKVGRPRKMSTEDTATTKPRKKKAKSETETVSRKKSVKSSRTESKSTRATKAVVTPHNESESVEDLQIQPMFPFEGTTAPTLPNTRGSHDIERIKLNGSRHYLVKHSHESYCFPSVTTVLDATQPPSMFFRLYNWRKSMIKEHGVAKSSDIAKEILRSGKNFHKEIEQVLLQSSSEDAISIKPYTTEKKPQSTSPVIKSTTLQNAHIRSYKPTTSVPIIVKDIKRSTGERNMPSQEQRAVVNDDSCTPPVHVPEEERAALDMVCEQSQSENGQYIAETTPEFDDTVAGSTTTTVNDLEAPKSVKSGSEVSTDNGVTGYMKSVEHVLKDITNVRAIESVVSHVELGYTGMFDCLAEYRGELCVIDWKTSSKPKPTLADCYNNPLQAAAYAGAINQDHHYPFKVKSAVIVIVYPNGDPAHAHYLSPDHLLSYWRDWLEKLEQYHTQFASDLTELIV